MYDNVGQHDVLHQFADAVREDEDDRTFEQILAALDRRRDRLRRRQEASAPFLRVLHGIKDDLEDNRHDAHPNKRAVSARFTCYLAEVFRGGGSR